MRILGSRGLWVSVSVVSVSTTLGSWWEGKDWGMEGGKSLMIMELENMIEGLMSMERSREGTVSASEYWSGWMMARVWWSGFRS